MLLYEICLSFINEGLRSRNNYTMLTQKITVISGVFEIVD